MSKKVEEIVHCAVDFGQVAVGDILRRLKADAYLETGRAPVDKLNGALRLQRSDSSMYVLWYHVSTIQKASGHVFSIAGIAFHHLVIGLETGHRDLLYRVAFMRRLGMGNYWCIGDKRKMNPRVRNQVGLELIEIHVKRAIKPEGCSDG